MTSTIRVALGFVVSIAVVLTATVSGVSASSSVKSYSAALVSPASAIAGSTTTYTFQFTNSTFSTNTMGSVQIALPAGFSGLKPGVASAPNGAWEEVAGACVYGSPTPCPTVLQVDTGALGGTGKLNPGQSLTLTLTATAPVTPGVYTWNTAAKPSSDFSGTSLFTLSGAQPSIIVASPRGLATQLAIVSVTDEGTGLPEPVKAQPFDVAFVTEDAFGNPSPVSQQTTVALTLQTGTGTGTLSGTLTATIPAGQSQDTIAGALYSVAENGVVLVVSATAGDSLHSAQDKVNVQSFAASIVGTPGVPTTLSATACQNPTPQLPTCAVTFFQHGVKGKAFLSGGVCQGIATNCLTNGTEISLLMNVTANMKDANGNPLYSRTDPAVTVVACDKSLCGGGGINTFVLLVDLHGTGNYVQAPACPSKGTIAPTGVPFCVDYVTSHRDNAGDTLLYFDFADDFIIHY